LKLSFIFLLLLLCAYAVVGYTAARCIGLAALCLWCALDPLDDRRIKLFLCGLFVFMFVLAVAPVLIYANISNELKFDPYLHAIDHTLGFCPSGWIVAHVYKERALLKATYILYEFLPIVMVAAYGWALYFETNSKALFCTYLFAPVASLLFFIVPAAGPAFLLGPEIFHAHPTSTLSLFSSTACANSIPSMHLAGAITLWYFNRSRAVIRRLLAIFVVITAYATLALGEHYLVDLMLSLPAALFMIAAVTRRYWRAAAILGLMMAWLFAIRLIISALIAHSVMLWLGLVLTNICSVLIMRQSRNCSRPDSAEIPAVAQTEVLECAEVQS